MRCNTCGKEIENDSNFCYSCGAKVSHEPAVSPAPEPAVYETSEQKADAANETPSYTAFAQNTPPANSQPIYTNPAQNTVRENKIVNILAYLGIFFFLPLVITPESKAGRFHANQGLVLFITSLIGSVLIRFAFLFCFIVPWRFAFISVQISSLWGIVIFVLMLIGMIHASKNEEKELPVIGSIRIIK